MLSHLKMIFFLIQGVKPRQTTFGRLYGALVQENMNMVATHMANLLTNKQLKGQTNWSQILITTTSTNCIMNKKIYDFVKDYYISTQLSLNCRNYARGIWRRLCKASPNRCALAEYDKLSFVTIAFDHTVGSFHQMSLPCWSFPFLSSWIDLTKPLSKLNEIFSNF